MNKLKNYTFKNKILSYLRFTSKSGSKENLFKYWPSNSKIHERIKFEVFMKLIDNDFDVYTEIELTNKDHRIDILAIKGTRCLAIEVETPKDKLETIENNRAKDYPLEMELITIIADNKFNINEVEI